MKTNENEQVGQLAQIVKDYAVVSDKFWIVAMSFIASFVATMTAIMLNKGY